MSSIDSTKFYELGYAHDELEALLAKIKNGSLLTKGEYEKLVKAIDMIDNLTNFNGTYESLVGKPDILEVVRQANEFVTFEKFDAKARTILAMVEAEMNEKHNEVIAELEQYKNHNHDNLYSLLNHAHEERYATKDEVKGFVTKDYLDSVIAGLGPGTGGGGSIYPTYIEPVLVIKSNNSYVTHKKETSITITPTFTRNDAGDITKVTLKKNNEIIYESTEVKNYVDAITLKHGEKATYTITVEYGAGPIKNTTLGDPYPNTAIKAGVMTKTVSVQGIANSYYGIIGDKQFVPEDVQSFTSVRNVVKGFTTVFNLDNQKAVYMYPKSLGELSSIKDMNNFDYIFSYTFSVIEYDEVQYNCYVLTDAVTVDVGFKQIFS